MAIFSSLYTGRLDRELGTDDSTILFTTARRKAAVNEGQEEFARLTKCLLRRSTITLTGGTGEYDLHSTAVIADGDFVEFAAESPIVRYTDASSNVTIVSGASLERRDPVWLNAEESGWQTSTGSSGQQLPSYWYERFDGGARYLGLTPVPSTGSSASVELVLPYVARPTPMTSDTHEPFLVGSAYRTDLRWYHQALVHYAASQLEKLRRDDQASDRQYQRFTGYVGQYLQEHLRRRGGNTLRTVRRYFRQPETVKDPRV